MAKVLLGVLSVSATGLVACTTRPSDGDHTTYANVRYVAGGTTAQTLDLYVPTAGQSHRLVIYVHGGAWLGGSKSALSWANTKPLLDAGLAVATINYTLSGAARFPQQIFDVKAAIRFVRANAANYRLDGWIGLWGSSAGAHLAALAGTTCGIAELEGNGGNRDTTSCVQAVAEGYGPTDFLQMDDHLTVPGSMKHNPAGSPESLLLGCNQGLLACPPERVQAANPITYINDPRRTGQLPRFLIAHGETDPVVPIWQSVILYRALTPADADVVFYTLHNVGHGFFEAGALNPAYPAATRQVSRPGYAPATDQSPLSRQALTEFFIQANN
jgi:acetyl esterase/lipase